MVYVQFLLHAAGKKLWNLHLTTDSQGRESAELPFVNLNSP